MKTFRYLQEAENLFVIMAGDKVVRSCSSRLRADVETDILNEGADIERAAALARIEELKAENVELRAYVANLTLRVREIDAEKDRLRVLAERSYSLMADRFDPDSLILADLRSELGVE